MPIRITGMNSGLDTESIITALTQRQKDRLDTAKNDQKKLTWKQDKWKELNKKVVSFYNGALSSMRFSTAYTKKTTSASNANAVSVITGDSAMDSTQTLDITSLAKSAYLTGQQVKAGTEKAKASNTMADLGLESGGTLKFSIGGDSEDLIEVDVAATDSISDVLSKLKNAKSSKTETSLNFNFDENNGRFFVSSKTAGAAASFDMVESDAMTALGFTRNDDGSNYIAGSSAKIKLNGVEYESESNTFNINGLTITANEIASGITLTTKQDTSGIYDNIKKLVKEYSELMKELSTLYNADAAKKYSMLTDDQKDAMSDDEVEEWEKKIKDGLLSKDETIGSVRDSLKSIVLKGFEVTMADGSNKTMSLASFGISTGSYFSTTQDERDMLHIDGDPDDSSTSGNTDLLKAFISSDPGAVTNFFTQLSKEMYSSLTNLMKGTEFSSAYTIYEDKLMASQYSSYNTKISNAQKALEAAQDKYYKKFSTMESTLSKINSNSSSFSSFFGG
ncbi:flagellar filament capping protein FliD [Butyrivibrio sp. FCS014]|uniref:flagellar filament capping protein FliD n=1 Tax=Butyrivibrio sp. FCS014 TaxID=1408304 RepID=UPI0004ACCD3D|nr:flagellar filament capping protein FliD [Butyrivibrio sp. FCS014]